MVKVAPRAGATVGWSSGAGGAVFRSNGRLFRLKRCGYRNEGIGRSGPVLDRAFVPDGAGRVCARRVATPLGLCHPLILTRELETLGCLRAAGFVSGIEAVARYSVAEDGDAVLLEIQSDLRVDELALLLWRQGHRALSMNRASLVHLALSLFHDVGKAYRDAHLAGFTRGVGNAWFGNDVVLASGRVTFVDTENAFVPESVTANRLRKLQLADLRHYRSSVVAGSRTSAALGTVGDAVLNAFNRGYREATDSGASGERQEAIAALAAGDGTLTELMTLQPMQAKEGRRRSRHRV